MKSIEDFKNKIICGDCLEVMKEMPDNSVDTIITDPPYGLEFMGKEWDKFPSQTKYYKFSKLWAIEALRVAKPGATLLVFGGTRTWHRLACAIEDAGWIIKDTLMWLFQRIS
jgi:site-specific DNA-methyltransferase (adenine-specific)